LRLILKDTLLELEGKVTTEVTLNGAYVVVVRESINQNKIMVGVEGDFSVVTPEALRSMIPIQSFVQGELSTLSSEGASKSLLALVTDSKRTELSTLDEQKSQLNSVLRKVTDDYLSHEEGIRKSAELHLKKATLTAQLSELSKKVTSEDQNAKNIIDINPIATSINQAFGTVDSELVLIAEQLDPSIVKIQEILSGIPPMGIEKIDPHLDSLRQLSNPISNMKAEIDKKIGEIRSQFEQILSNWNTEYSEHKEKYKLETEKLSTSQKILIQIDRVNSEVTSVTTQESNLANSQSAIKHTASRLAEYIESSQAIQKARIKIVAGQVAKLESRSSGFVSGQLSGRLNIAQFKVALIAVFQGTGVRSTRIDNLLNKILDDTDPFKMISKILLEFVSILNTKNAGDATLKEDFVSDLLTEFEIDHLNNLLSVITFERVLELVNADVRPNINLYRQKDGQKIPFSQASQGEQAAGLLTVLMRQASGPLIIDQPEEDLDNRIIGEIVNALSLTKESRQLILATHNANIVVNGDSENVIELRKGFLSANGAIDNDSVKSAITETMEGGETAFELRRVKYNFDRN